MRLASKRQACGTRLQPKIASAVMSHGNIARDRRLHGGYTLRQHDCFRLAHLGTTRCQPRQTQSHLASRMVQKPRMTQPDLANVTACLTMGRRPELLERTLVSLQPLLSGMSILAVNDFGDEATNRIFRTICPQGRIIDLPGHVGHHRAVDAMYSEVQTDYVFHLEDDWVFDRQNFIPDAISVLRSAEQAAVVCVRHVDDFVTDAATNKKIKRLTTQDDIVALNLNDIHSQWYGYTFNPHVARISLWRNMGGFAGYKKERHISRNLRAMGGEALYLNPGACRHVGANDSVATTGRPSLGKRLKSLFRHT